MDMYVNSGDINRVEYFANESDAKIRADEIIKRAEDEPDLYFDGFVKSFSFYNISELLCELNKIMDLKDGHLVGAAGKEMNKL